MGEVMTGLGKETIISDLLFVSRAALLELDALTGPLACWLCYRRLPWTQTSHGLRRSRHRSVNRTWQACRQRTTYTY